MRVPTATALTALLSVALVTASPGQRAGGSGARTDAPAQAGWHANPEIVRQQSAKQANINYAEEHVAVYELPDPLRTGRGAIVRTAADWPARRNEIRELFRQHVYGRSPGAPERLRFDTIEQNAAAMDGAATLKRVAVVSTQAGREHRFELILFLPNPPSRSALRRASPDGGVPLFLLLNNRPATNTDPTRKEKSGFWPAEQVIAAGYGIAALQVGELAPDDKDRFREGVIKLFEGTVEGTRPADAWGGLAAWAWGASRAMDYFVTDRAINPKRIAVVGHSRGGKAALWAGAEDERFAMVISNESGEGGAALSRRNYGETLARITEVFPHWFARNYTGFAGREAALPVDQHMLLSLVAPRALYVASADEDLWSDPRGEFLSLAHTSPVFALWGDPPIARGAMPPLQRPLVSGRRGYHVRAGTHNLTPYDWERFLDFAGSLWD
jgi:hypothetical protein